jgi:ribose transport system substrate-binding protein
MHMSRSARPGRGLVAAAAAIAAVLLLSGCTTDAGGDGASASASPSAGDDVAAQLAELYDGIFTDPPTDGPAAQSGKDVWYISCGESFAACSSSSAAFQEAGEVLGWQVNVFDGSSDPAKTASGIEQAIASGADGIAILAMDCALITGALQQAQAAGIPVVNAQGMDCEDPLFTASVNVAGTDDFCQFYKDWGKYKALYTEAIGAGGAILDLNETSQELQKCTHEGFLEQIATCDTCSIAADVPWSFATIGDLGSIVSSALLANPDATAINVSADTLIPAFVAPAVQEQGSTIKIIGGEGYGPNFELIRSGVQTVSIAYSFPWIAWGQADALNRVFAEGDDAEQPNQGGGFQAIDADNNLPEGDTYEPPVDFRSLYRAIWEG